MLKYPFDIPKEIRTKPKMLGLEVGELVALGIVALLTLTVFKDMVHGYFTIPLFLVIGLLCLYLVVPSVHNPNKKNYHAIFLLFKRDKSYYQSIDVHVDENLRLYESIQKKNEELFNIQNDRVYHSKEKTKEEIILRNHLDKGSDPSLLNGNNEKEEKIHEDNSINQVISLVVEVDKSKQSKESLNTVVPTESQVANEKEEVEEEKEQKVEEKGLMKGQEKQEHKKVVKEIESIQKKNEELLDNNNNKSLRKERKIAQNKRRKGIAFLAASLLFIAIGIFVVVNPINISFERSSESVSAEQEEMLVSALRSFSLKDYDAAMSYFDKVDYNSINYDDKDVMLLSYLFGGEPRKALELEPGFDETVASYYKATYSMQEIRDLALETDSKVFQFEVAVADKDYEKIVELREHVKIKDDRDEIIVYALLELGEFYEAKEFAIENGNSELVDFVENFKKENKKKKDD